MFVARLVLELAAAGGDRRQQLKWLMAGSTVAVAGFVIGDTVPALGDPAASRGRRRNAALPVCLGMAILKYRLYDIDRIISRTLAYAIVTGLLVGVYAGLVLLATRVLSVPHPGGGGCRHAGRRGAVQPGAAAGAAGGGPAVQPGPV